LGPRDAARFLAPSPLEEDAMTVESSNIYPLGPDAIAPDWQITSAGTFVGAWLDDLAGTVALTAQVRFMVGTGGATEKVCLQSSMDQGATAYDVAIVNFATVPRTAIFEVAEVTTALIAPGEGGLNALGQTEPEGIIAGVLGDRLRVKVIVTGTYQNTTLSARVMPI
jgi:hypothetical protein